MASDNVAPQRGEISVERIEEIYSATAAFYDEVVAQEQAKAKLAAIEVLARQRGERFLEVGVGTAWAFARIIGDSSIEKAVGVDIAAGMIEVARMRLSEAAIAAAPLALADARWLPFKDGTFDCLLTTYTLEVLPSEEVMRVLGECRRVLRQDGRFVAVNLTRGEGEDAALTDDWQRRYAADPEFFGGARPVGLASAVEQAGFRDMVRNYHGPEWPSEIISAVRL
jgi:demethylmenaquinone methyltransferase/2-methoxy-6-polyprenyl-1,4-benzoquinol methylase